MGVWQPGRGKPAAKVGMGRVSPVDEAVGVAARRSDRFAVVSGRTQPPGSPSDEALMAGMAIGDERAAVTFVRRYQKRVFGLAVGLLNDPGVAEDVAQEALLRAWRHAPVFDARRGTVTSWVLTITRNLAIDAIRQRRALATDPDDLVALGLASGGRPVEDLAVASQLSPNLRGALHALPVEQRRATLLAALYGRTAEEISTSESIPLGTAKTRIRTGLQKLRAALDDAKGQQ
jgi:RNA polymerase sigma factor (sigma-70 family)